MTITVTQLNNYIRGIFSIDSVLGDLTVCGEITNVKRSRDGWYFSLKDDGGAINCFCYASASEPIAGAVAVVEGQVNYFVKTGSVSLFARRVTATTNTGAAYIQFVELKEKLHKEGLFDDNRKKSVPHSARKIGVVTSETGAVIHDITNVTLRRQPFTQLFLYPVKVQGIGADSEIVEGIRYFSDTDVDVVIVGRGGGSNEDLSVFNSEIVVRAIAECSKPIVSAVGHGIDFTLADFAADKRAVTPSEAAEFVTIDVEREKQRVVSNLSKINSLVNAKLVQCKETVVNSIRMLHYGIGHDIESKQSVIKYSLKSIERSVRANSEHVSLELDKKLNALSSLNPINVLKRGYAYLSSENGVIRSVKHLNVGDNVKLNLSDGSVNATITAKEVH